MHSNVWLLLFKYLTIHEPSFLHGLLSQIVWIYCSLCSVLSSLIIKLINLKKEKKEF